MRLKWKICVLLTLFVCLPAYAAIGMHKHMATPQLIGEARLKVMLWNVFDAKLYSQSGHYDANEPFALSLTYLRALDGDKIAAKSIEEIRNQGQYGNDALYSKWQAALNAIIPNVYKGTTLTGVRSTEGHTLFYLEDKEVGRIEDIEFTRAFFDIWLGDKSSNPGLRNSLIGTAKTGTAKTS